MDSVLPPVKRLICPCCCSSERIRAKKAVLVPGMARFGCLRGSPFSVALRTSMSFSAMRLHRCDVPHSNVYSIAGSSLEIPSMACCRRAPMLPRRRIELPMPAAASRLEPRTLWSPNRELDEACRCWLRRFFVGGSEVEDPGSSDAEVLPSAGRSSGTSLGSLPEARHCGAFARGLDSAATLTRRVGRGGGGVCLLPSRCCNSAGRRDTTTLHPSIS
mmetsp:Transcript_13087/g.39838  ORF Transcript_13087/g.39838 Transcript_13087/m.39838 type:complete len:217 (-) Transcript_13087:202-852(-)|eukprot:scaffold249325_cov30-Tisochrysis_lutea.AAC.16